MQQAIEEINKEIVKRNISTDKELNRISAKISHKYKLKNSPRKIHLFLNATDAQRKKTIKTPKD